MEVAHLSMIMESHPQSTTRYKCTLLSCITGDPKQKSDILMSQSWCHLLHHNAILICSLSIRYLIIFCIKVVLDGVKKRPKWINGPANNYKSFKSMARNILRYICCMSVVLFVGYLPSIIQSSNASNKESFW